MIYSALPTCKHPMVELRALATADLARWFEYLSLPVVYEHTSWNLSRVDDLAGYLDSSEQPAADSRLRLAIASRETGHLVGTIGFHSIWPQDRRAELAYDLSPAVWGQGIATYVVSLMVDWAHTDPGFDRVQATVLQSNARSRAVLDRCGFHFEGMLRQYRIVRGQPGDFDMYSHLARREHQAAGGMCPSPP
jgi:RimJ/RimL family protein N-acetyltransferase